MSIVIMGGYCVLVAHLDTPFLAKFGWSATWCLDIGHEWAAFGSRMEEDLWIR